MRDWIEPPRWTIAPTASWGLRKYRFATFSIRSRHWVNTSLDFQAFSVLEEPPQREQARKAPAVERKRAGFCRTKYIA